MGVSEVPGRGGGREGGPLVGPGVVRLARASTAEWAASAGGRSCGRAPAPARVGGGRRAMRRVEGVAYLIGALKRNLKQSECFPIMVGLPVAAARTCLDQDMYSV